MPRSPQAIMVRLDGSGTPEVIEKLDAEKVGSSLRPFAPFRFNIRARTFKSALLSLRSKPGS